MYWEMYGLNPGGEAVTASVMVTRGGTGWLRRTAESLGLASRRREEGIEWDEVFAPDAESHLANRALALDLSGVAPGRYRIEVTVTAQGRGSLKATREIQVVRE